MRTIATLLAVAALALPAAAAAHHSPPPHPKKVAQAVQATRNAAWVCKTLRQADPALFKQSFGTNHNKRNAFGKCVSAHARAKHHGGTIGLPSFTLTSSGTVTDAGLANCQFTAEGCTVKSTGTVSGALAGTYDSTFTILWQQATPNPSVTGAFCAPASGDVTLSLTGLGTLTKHETGTMCETTATGPNVPHAFTGTFTVSSGTGVFAGATGSGTSTFTQQPGATSAQGGAVSGSETFQSLTLTL